VTSRRLYSAPVSESKRSPNQTENTRSLRCRCLISAVVGLLLALPARARACGVSAAGVASCSLEEHNEAVRPRWVVGLSGLYTATSLRFGDDVHAHQQRAATLAALAYLPTSSLALQAGLGVAFAGSLRLADGKYTFTPGPIASLGLDWRAFDDGLFFAQLTSLLSFSSARTRLDHQSSVAYSAFDLRLGGQFGVTIARVLRPYVLARAFGGPVFWRYRGEAVTGTDTHHYQIGMGLSARLARRINLFAEAVPLGEQAVIAGGAVAF